MNRIARIFALATVTLAVIGCEARTDKSDGGGVLLSISDFNNLPTAISASAVVADGQVPPSFAPPLQITVQSIIKNPNQSTSELMNVEIESYEVTFQRDDTGTRIPPRLKNFIFGSVGPGGTFVVDGAPIMRVDQLVNQPMRDMAEFGFDPETKSVVIRLKVGIQFFGRTISGDTVESSPAFFTLEVFP